MIKTVFSSTLLYYYCIEHFPTAFASISHNYIYVYIYIYIYVYIYIYIYRNKFGGRVYLGIKCSVLW